MADPSPSDLDMMATLEEEGGRLAEELEAPVPGEAELDDPVSGEEEGEGGSAPKRRRKDTDTLPVVNNKELVHRQTLAIVHNIYAYFKHSLPGGFGAILATATATGITRQTVAKYLKLDPTKNTTRDLSRCSWYEFLNDSSLSAIRYKAHTFFREKKILSISRVSSVSRQRLG